MGKIPKWVWLLVAAGGAYYLYNRYKSTTIALTSASATPTGQALPGTPNAIAQASNQIASGITSIFNQV